MCLGDLNDPVLQAKAVQQPLTDCCSYANAQPV